MTVREKMASLRAMCGTDENDEVLLAYLKLAGEKLLNRCYPFQPENHQVPARYHSLQVEIACYLINKRGAEGEVVHNENGINRSYASADVPESMLRDVVPYVGVL